MSAKIRIVLANLPLKVREGRRGVRAGSRWPHTRPLEEAGYVPFPFFLAYATALLKKHGFQAVLVDALAWDLTREDFNNKIIEAGGCDYLVVETSWPFFEEDVFFLKELALQGARMILCGPSASSLRSDFLRDYPFIFALMIGEYEQTLRELAGALSSGGDFGRIPGLVYRSRDSVVVNPARQAIDLNILPWPERESLKMERYFDAPCGMPLPSAQMVSSRGCPFSCVFCLWPQVMYPGGAYRTRKITDVLDEMEFLVREKGYASVYFDDDTFNVERARVLAFCQQIESRGLNKTPWAMMGRPDLVDSEQAEKLKAAGLWAVKFGIESGSQEILDACGKQMDLGRAIQGVRLTQAAGIRVHLTFSIGLPGETKETIEKTFALARELEPDSAQFSIATPFPGTRFYADLKEKVLLAADAPVYLDGYNNCVFSLPGLSAQQIQEYLQQARFLGF